MSQEFQLLFWFEDSSGVHKCYKAISAEFYLVQLLNPDDSIKNEKYMSREKYDNFLIEKGIL